MWNQNDFAKIEHDGKGTITKIIIIKTKEDGSVDLNELRGSNNFVSIGNYGGTCALFLERDDLEIKKLDLPRCVRSIKPGTFTGTHVDSIVWPTNCFEIPPQAFSLSKIREIQNIDHVISIGHDAFFRSSITDFRVPDAVEEIPRNCFMFSNLRNMTNTKHILKIGGNAFAATLLTSFCWPDHCKTIEKRTFSNCSRLQQIDNVKNVDEIKSNAFERSGLRFFKWPSKCHYIPQFAFASCGDLQGISGLENVLSIKAFAFYYSGISDIDLSNSVCVEIKESAFAHSKLTMFKPGYYLDNISKSAFEHTKIARKGE